MYDESRGDQSQIGHDGVRILLASRVVKLPPSRDVVQKGETEEADEENARRRWEVDSKCHLAKNTSSCGWKSAGRELTTEGQLVG